METNGHEPHGLNGVAGIPQPDAGAADSRSGGARPAGPKSAGRDCPEYQRVSAKLQERWPDAQVVPSLEREELLVDLLGSPHTGYPVIHLTGTNGKSSTTRAIDALLRACDLRVGRFTSPEFELYERIAIDGEQVTTERFAELFDEVAPYVDLVDAKVADRLTAFEILTAMAFAAFADAPVDVAVVEVGMGGAWDCTNVVDGQVAVILPIALDHQEYLGDRIEDIAQEKAGIIKPGATVLLARQEPEVDEIIAGRCAEVGATLVREGPDISVLRREPGVGGQRLALRGRGGVYDDIYLPLYGAHQAQNALLALAAVESFFGATRSLDPDLVRAGFAQVSSPGRLERIRSSPMILLDAAHNPAGMAATVATVREEFAFRRIVAVLGVLADKDARGIVEQLAPLVDAVVVTRNSSPRAMPAGELAAVAAEVLGPERVHARAELPDAVSSAVTLVEGDLHGVVGATGILITGSVVTVADARQLLTD